MVRPPETFATARLFARPPRRDDAPAVFAAWAADPAVTRYLSWGAYTQVEALADFLGSGAEAWARGTGHLAWLLFPHGEETPVGSVGLTFEGAGRVMAGYVIARPHWGRGFATEALRPLVDWTLAQPEYYRCWAYCDTENPASARVMEKAGMVREGVLRRWAVSPTLGPEPRDCIVCAKVR